MDRDWYELKLWLGKRERTKNSYDIQMDHIIMVTLDTVMRHMDEMEAIADGQSLLEAGY